MMYNRPNSKSPHRRASIAGCQPILKSLPIVALLVAGIILTACSSSGSTGSTKSTSAAVGDVAGDLRVVASLPPPEQSAGGNLQKIAASDILEIDVFQVDDLDRTVRVDTDGTISMPLIGNIQAGGLTIAELERSLEARYGANYLRSPEITVFMKESVGQRVTMDGEFRKPGIYPVTSQSSLLQAVAEAGGLDKLADEKKVYVYREFSSGRMVANYSIADIRAGKKSDPKIFGGDVVVAFSSDAKVAAQNLREALGMASSAARAAAPF